MSIYPVNYAPGDHVIVLHAEHGTLEAIVEDVGFTGRAQRIPVYVVSTIHGNFTLPDCYLCPADNVVVLRHGAEVRDTLPCEMDPVA